MSITRGISSLGKAFVPKGLPGTLPTLPSGGMQIRRFSQIKKPGDGQETSPPAGAAVHAQKARSLSFSGGVAPTQFGRRLTSALVIPGGSGSQGAVAAYAAALNFDKTHDHGIVIPARDPAKAEAETRVVGGDGKSQRLADMPGVQFVKTASDSGVSPGKMDVLVTVPSPALQGILHSLPKGVGSVAATYNGTPPIMDTSEPDHGVSMYTSGPAADSKQGFVYGKGGFLTFAQDAPQLRELETLFEGGTVIQIKSTPDIRTTQWGKVALNTALNSLATIFSVTLGELTDRMEKEPQFNALVNGIVKEVCDVAARNGAKPAPQTVMQSIREVGKKSASHRTSMGNAFMQGKPTEVDVLSGGVAAQGQAKGVGTPLCALATVAIKTMERFRGSGPVPSDFEQTHGITLKVLRQCLLDAAAQLDTVKEGSP